MQLPPAPPTVPCAVHGARALGWVALLELILGAALVSTAKLGGVGLWILAGGGLHVLLGAALGLGLDAIPGLRARPALACGLIAAAVIALGLGIDGDLGVAVPALVGGGFAWSRWRFPGAPSRGRTIFRGLFFSGLAGGLLLLGGRPLAPWRYADGAADPALRSVLIVVMDTVRRDHLSTYGYARDTAPNLDALAARGARYPGQANACWSLPGHATALTGLYSGEHGANYEGGQLVAGTPTLQGVFGAAGYDTVAITGNPWVHVGNGLGDGFGAFMESWSRTLVPAAFLGLRALRPLWDRDRDKGGAFAARQLGAWLDGRPAASRPFFAFVNLMEAHAPYAQVRLEDSGRYLPPGFDTERASALSMALLDHHLRGAGAPSGADVDRAIDLYDGAIRGADRALGGLLAALEGRGLLANTAVLVVADHGEYFGEHGLWGHVHGLYEPVLEVPFVVAGPGVAPGVFETPGRLIDVAPTALSLSGLPRADWPAMEGRPVGEGAAGDVRVAEQYGRGPGGAGGRAGAGGLGVLKARRRSWSDGVTKLLEREGEAPRVFDLALDPGEESPLASPERRALAAQGLAGWAARTGIAWPDALGAGPQVGGWQAEALEALGYVE